MQRERERGVGRGEERERGGGAGGRVISGAIFSSYKGASLSDLI